MKLYNSKKTTKKQQKNLKKITMKLLKNQMIIYINYKKKIKRL